MPRHGLLVTAVVAVVALSCQLLWAGRPVYVGAQVPPRNRVSIDQIDHSKWDTLLRKHVNSDGMVDYRAWEASQRDVAKLDAYLDDLSKADRSQATSRDARLAYWINAYNAVTIRGILREFPTDSIRNHTPRLFGYHIWKDLQLYVDGKAYSLNQIEHEILRQMAEPRIHFAIVCASISCPRLLNEAYVPNRLEKQLEINARDFFSRPRNFRYDASQQRFYLSSILDWFGSDFGESKSAQLRRIAAWLPSPEARRAARNGSVSVRYLDYNWALNAQHTP